MNLTWLNLNCSYSHSSLAAPLLQLASRHLSDIHWTMVEGFTQDNPFALAMRVVDTQPELLCASLYLFNRDAVLNVLSRVKVLLPNVIILVGGPECLGEGAEQLQQTAPYITHITSGEGEEQFPALLQSLTGHPSTGTPSPIYHDWAQSPAPATSSLFQFDKPFIQIETSRGCPFGCQYCTSAGTVVRYKSLDAVKAELTLVRQHGVREIRLLDRTFNTPESRCVQLLQLFRNEFPDIRFHLEVHPQFLTAPIRHELEHARPGQLHIEAGIQTLHDPVLKAVGRPPHARQALDGLQFLVSCHPLFDTHCDLLAGLPEQTYKGLLEDLCRLVTIAPAEIQLEVLKILPGTILKARADSLGIRYSPVPPYDVMATPDMSIHDIDTVRRLSRLIDLFFNHPAITATFATAHREHNDTIPNLLDWLTANHSELLAAQVPGLDRRLSLLHDFFGNRYPDASFELACAWLRAAHTPNPGSPAATATLTRDIPAQAQLVSGSADCLDDIHTRLWRMEHISGRKTAIFAFNRATAPNHAVAEWHFPC